MDQISAQVDYMATHKIETLEDLYEDRSRLQEEMELLISKRSQLQNKIRRADPAEKEKLRQEKQVISAQINNLRKQIKCSFAIEDHCMGIVRISKNVGLHHRK